MRTKSSPREKRDKNGGNQSKIMLLLKKIEEIRLYENRVS